MIVKGWTPGPTFSRKALDPENIGKVLKEVLLLRPTLQLHVCNVKACLVHSGLEVCFVSLLDIG